MKENKEANKVQEELEVELTDDNLTEDMLAEYEDGKGDEN